MKIKILQLNIWRGELLDNAVEFLKKENPDIITLQEVYDGKDQSLPSNYRTFEFLKETFPEYQAVFSAQFCDITKVGNIDEGNAIFSKFPIISHKSTFFDISYSTFNNHNKTRFDDNPQAVLHAQLDAQGTTLNVFSLHGIWGFDGKDSERRFAMVDKTISEFSGKENIVLAGDFNLNPDTEAVRKIEKHLQSVFGNTLKSTFNMKFKTNPGYATAVVDMIFVSPEITVLEKECPVVDASDHLPLLVTLEIT